MGMRRLAAIRSDAQSRDTTYSGLPKAARAYDATGQGVGAGWVGCGLDTLQFNYGGFNFTGGGGFNYTNFVIPEPGIYMLMTGCQWVSGQAHVLGFNLNGNLGLAAAEKFGQQEVPNLAFPPRAALSSVVELKAGDTVAMAIYNDVGVSTVNANTAWLYVEKLGGQY